MTWRIGVEYVEDKDHAIKDIDEKLEGLAGKPREGSGFYFQTSTRDLQFEFETRDAARKAKQDFRHFAIETSLTLRVFDL